MFINIDIVSCSY